MSIKALVESIDTARVNNSNLEVKFQGKLNALQGELIDASTEFQKTVAGICEQIDAMKTTFAAEVEERDRDLVRLVEGAA